jgi:hypothetical protein
MSNQSVPVGWDASPLPPRYVDRQPSKSVAAPVALVAPAAIASTVHKAPTVRL